ncbi:hypothetical protein GCM10017786_11100 [Amycolatopsis deserti]|uniref:Cobalt transporter n=1 Tax=Amycolatopsis deserti TaxID=185696 RepID=A0ABQ3IF12_9PSEU|nr:hypothetical protein [Amycolatopsis deserti]GHE82146.1 hypothetical protein GCM10017786_11100 [Amycolatopsis deserti]
MTPRTTVAVISVVAMAVGAFVGFQSLMSLMAEPAFVTATGAACDPSEQLRRYVLEDCFPAKLEAHPVGVALSGFGLLGLIYARLLMPHPGHH